MNMDKPIYERVNKILMVISAVITTVLVFYFYLEADYVNVRFRFEKPVSWTQGWKLDGEDTKIPFKIKVAEGKEVELSNTLPEVLEYDTVLSFTTENGWCRVFVDDELIYSYGEHTRLYFGSIRGKANNFIPIDKKYAGKEIKIVFVRGYDGFFNFEDIILSNRDKVAIQLFTHDLWKIFLISIFASIGLMAFGLVIFGKKINLQTPKSFIIYFGVFNIYLGLWIFLDSVLYQFATDNMDSANFLRYFVILSLGVCYIGCNKYIFPPKWDAFVIIQVIGGIAIALCSLLFVSGIADPEKIRWVTHLYIMICALYTFIVSLKYMNKNEYAKGMFVIITVLTFFCIVALYESTYYPATDWDTKSLCIGYVLFCIGLIYVIEKMNINNTNEVLAGEVHAHMAYKDPMTMLGNRVAFENSLDEIEKEKNNEIITIIMCDLNYLKKINDTLGHEKGDELITSASKVFKNAVSDFGKVYRIGGDEFCIICHGSDNYSELVINRIRSGINNHNLEEELTISCAIGFATAVSKDINDIRKLFKEADDNMYIDKKNYHK